MRNVQSVVALQLRFRPVLAECDPERQRGAKTGAPDASGATTFSGVCDAPIYQFGQIPEYRPLAADPCAHALQQTKPRFARLDS